VAALHVQRFSFSSPTVDQVARPVSILRILFDYLAIGDGVPYLLHTDATENALIDGVFGELELIGLDLPAKIIY
jgi:hypothetical protein